MKAIATNSEEHQSMSALQNNNNNAEELEYGTSKCLKDQKLKEQMKKKKRNSVFKVWKKLKKIIERFKAWR